MAKKLKLEPIKVTSLEHMRVTVGHYCRLKAERAEAQAVMDQEIIRVQAQHADALARLDMAIASHEQGVAVFCDLHPEIFPDKRKSIDLPTAVVGFRTNPPSVQKARGMSKVNGKDMAVRLASVEITEGGRVVFSGEHYIRFGDPEIDKVRLLADRDIIPPQALQAAGLVISQEEEFFISPKTED